MMRLDHSMLWEPEITPAATFERRFPSGITTADRRRIEKLEACMGRLMTKANADWHLIEEGDRIMVALSGGKDSFTLLNLLIRCQRLAPFRFNLYAFHLDYGLHRDRLPPFTAYLEKMNVPCVIGEKDIPSIVTNKVPPGETRCALCSRLRRGIIYTEAVERGCTKIALGHHRDDLLETFLMNCFFIGQLRTMPPKLLSDDKRNIVIRPMAYVPEELIIEYSRLIRFPIIPCGLCRNKMRPEMKNLLKTLESSYPSIKGTMLSSLKRVQPKHLLDKRLFSVPEGDDFLESRRGQGQKGLLFDAD